MSEGHPPTPSGGHDPAAAGATQPVGHDEQEAARADIEATRAALAACQAEREACQAELAACRAELATASAKLARAQALVDNVPAAVFLKDHESRALYLNSYMLRHLAHERWLGASPWNIYPPEAAAHMIADDQRALTEGPQIVRDWLPTLAGVDRLFETRKFPVVLPDGTRLLGGVAVDVTDSWQTREELSRQREHLEELVATRTSDLQRANRELQAEVTRRTRRETQLRAQWERFAVILEHFPELVYVVDPGSHELLFVNRKLRDLLGFDPLGRSCHEVLRGSQTPCKGCTDPLLLPDRGALTWELDNEHLGRSYLMVDQLVPWPDGRQVRFEVAVDITRRRRAEKALQQKAVALEQSTGDLRELAYVASHHLQTPLRSVRGFLQLLRRECQASLSARGREFLGFAEQAAEAMTGLITDLDEYLKVERSETELREIDASETVDLVLQKLQSAISTRGAEVSAQRPLPRLRVHPGQLYVLLAHLLDNAIEFGGAPPRVRLWAEPVEPGWWELLVDDNGQGVPAEQRERVFRLFVQLEPGRTARGTGLGLAICRRIVDNHGGRLAIEDGPDGGCRVSVLLPGPEAQARPVLRSPELATPAPRLKTELPQGLLGAALLAAPPPPADEPGAPTEGEADTGDTTP